EARHAAPVERDDLSVDQAVRQPAAVTRDLGELVRPVEPLAGANGRLAVRDAHLHAIAVELDLVAPARLRRGALDESCQLRRHEFRGSRLAVRSPLAGAAGAGANLRPVAGACRPLRHERRRSRALPVRDLRHPAARCDRSIALQQPVTVVSRVAVAVLDQEPVRALSRVAIPLQAYEDPFALEALAGEQELELAGL